MTLIHKGFDKARRLGLQGKAEQFSRQSFPVETGILVIKSVVLGGPADKMHLEPEDLLVHVNGELVTQFLKLETVLDESVGKTYTMSGIADCVVMDIYKYINKHLE
jgi:S1-C subfamily serine protease